ncbi:Hypothetical protein A7982_05475 [Minicystis rosea]|nr:Hypothetical protein A7982_05475 [Minicystis rosea]
MRSWLSKPRIFAACALSAALIASPALADNTVVLHPGVLQGTIGLSGHTVSGGYVSVSSYDGFSSSADFTGSSYALTVEGGHGYNPYLRANVSNSSAWSTYLYINKASNISVDVGATVTDDYIYPAADITGSITIVGGTLDYFNLRADASSPEASFSVQSSFPGGSASGYRLPMIQNGAVTLDGTVTVTPTGGAQVTLPLDARVLAVGAGGVTSSWTLDLTSLSPGSIKGTISTPLATGGDILQNHWVYAYGAYGTPTQDVSASTYVAANGPYELKGLVTGTYNTYAYTYFDAPYGYIQHRSSTTTVAPGIATTINYGGTLSFLRGDVTLEGFFDTSTVTSGSVRARESLGSYAYDNFTLPGTHFDLALTPGTWTLDGYTVTVANTGGPDPINATFEAYGLSSSTYNLTGGTDAPASPRSLMTAETRIIFDVREPDGSPEKNITSANVQGYAWQPTGGYKYIRAYGPSTPNPHPAVRVVGEPGTYSVNALGTVDGSEASFGSFNLTLLTPVYTDATQGFGYATPAPGVTLDFPIIAPGGSGYTTAAVSPIGPEPPSGLQLTSDPPLYYDITTTVDFVGTVYVCITYSDPQPNEASLQLMHYSEESGTWEDITFDLNRATNRICGYTPGFSVFAVMVPEDVDGDGVPLGIDNCPEVANSDQTDTDGDGLGDACDPDDDNDGVLDALDHCPLISDPADFDSDGDGFGDACDPCPLDAQNDADHDGVCGNVDNCPSVRNPSQHDTDGDGIGDACDQTCIDVYRSSHGGGRVADAQIVSDKPTKNHGKQDKLGVGYHDGPNRIMQSVLRFDLGDVPAGARVESASISLAPDHVRPATVNVHRLLAPWKEDTVTWSSIHANGGSAIDPTIAASFALDESCHGHDPDRVSFDAKSLAQSWLSSSNYGLLLEANQGPLNAFGSSESNQHERPKLNLCYTIPEP